MKNWLYLGLLFSSLGFALAEHGGSDGGGGNGVVCYENGTISSVELLDIYEGRQLENLTIMNLYSQDYMAFLTEALKKFDSPDYNQELTDTAAGIKRGLRFLGKGVRLKPIDDSNEIFIPANCKVEQMVNFQGPSRIFIVTDFWDLLPDNHKAALLLHETIWYMERASGAKNSARARRTVAQFFASNFTFEPVKYEPKTADMECMTYGQNNLGDITNTRFTLKKTDDNKCDVNFLTLNGAIVFSKSVTEIENCKTFMSPTVDTFSMEQIYDVLQGQTVSHAVGFISEVLESPQNTFMTKRRVSVKNLEFPDYDQNAMDVFCR